jgi:beta-xylosidase
VPGVLLLLPVLAWAARYPVIFADVPDMAMIRTGDAYYMTSTTMHMNPGVPIMKSTDLVNWRVVGYAHAALDDTDDLNLSGGKSAYGKGSWASCLRQHRGMFYVTTFAGNTGKTYVYRTRDIERGPWETVSFRPALHDHSLFFDDDGRVFMVHGSGAIRIVELTSDVTGLKPGGLDRVIAPNAGAPAGGTVGLPAEGSQLFKVHGKYYLFNITWPKGGMRTVIVHRADRITGPYEGRVALRDRGIAQGGLIDTPQGRWYAYLFQDCGAVGRIPFLVPVRWEDGWPVFGTGGKAPDVMAELAANGSPMPGLVAADEFNRRPGEPALPLVWQWNHNPDGRFWSVTERHGFLRLMAGRVDADFLAARNTLTQRTFGPQCSATTILDVSGMKDGDRGGLGLLQKTYGWVGVKVERGVRRIVQVGAGAGDGVDREGPVLSGATVHLRADCDFRDRADVARFFYSMDGRSWVPIGDPMKMVYTLPHFMGYRFALFCYATREPGGHADFDCFRPSASGEFAGPAVDPSHADLPPGPRAAFGRPIRPGSNPTEGRRRPE